MISGKKGPVDSPRGGLLGGVANAFKGLLRHLPLIGVLTGALQSTTGKFISKNLPTVQVSL